MKSHKKSDAKKPENSVGTSARHLKSCRPRKSTGALSKPVKWATWDEISGFFEDDAIFLEHTGEEFMSAWAEFCQHRHQKRAALTECAVRRMIRKLEKMGHDRAIAAIEFSIEQGYTGIYEPPAGRGQRAGEGKAAKPTEADRGEYPEDRKPLPRL